MWKFSLVLLSLCMLTGCQSAQSKKIEENRERALENTAIVESLEAMEELDEQDYIDESDTQVYTTESIEVEVSTEEVTTEELPTEESYTEESTEDASDSDFSRAVVESIIISYLSATDEELLKDFIDSYCISDIDLELINKNTVSHVKLESLAKSFDDDSYFTMFNAEYVSGEGSSFKSGSLVVYFDDSNKVYNIEVVYIS